MAIPGDPSVQDIILQGMKEGGQYTVTAGGTAYTEFKSYQFETLKSEMWSACKTDKFLETEAMMLSTVGKSALTLPTDFDSEVKLYLFDGDSGFRGTAQTGSSTSITFSTDFSASSAILGYYVFLISGTGINQYRQILSYDDTTKVATVDAWSVAPDNTTGYVVATVSYELHRSDYLRNLRTPYRPVYYQRTGIGLSIYPPPDQVYPVLMIYRSNLTRLDDTSSLFVKHLRERRSLWVQGVKTKTMLRYDDDRYMAEKSIWDQALMQYAAENCVFEQFEPNR